MKKKTDTPKEPQFPSRVVLGEGFPWANGLGTKENPYKEVTLRDKPVAGQPIVLSWPTSLWKKNVPKYRLVLEKVE